jgi:hypothetical protein
MIFDAYLGGPSLPTSGFARVCPNVAKRMECVQLAAAFDARKAIRTLMGFRKRQQAARTPYASRHTVISSGATYSIGSGVLKAAASCTHSIRFAMFEPGSAMFRLFCPLIITLLTTPTAPAATLFDSSGFEAPTYSLGLLDGQNGWNSVDSSTEGVVQSNVVSTGSQAVMMSGATTAWQFPTLQYIPFPGEIIRISFDVRRSAFTSLNNFGYFVDIYNTSAEGGGRIARTGLVRTGSPSAPGRVQALITIGGDSPGSFTIGSPLLNETWYRFVVDLNFASNTWSLRINGSTIGCALPFVTPSLGIGDADLQISATGGSTDAGYFDNYLVETIVPQEPAITCPTDQQVNCGDSTGTNNTGTATITGDFSQPVTITHSDTPTPPSCTGLAGIDRTWIARDVCGLERSCVQHITIVDTNAPSITCPTNRLLLCGDSTETNNTGIATVTDDCSGVASIIFTDIRTNGISAGNYIIARTWAASDNCGNTATCVQTITVIDTNGPVIVCPLDVTNDCVLGITTNVTGMATATDDCSGVASIIYQDVRPRPGCAGSYRINRTWTAIDNGGNSSTCTQHVTVIDTMPPVITCPSNLVLSCASLVPAPDTNSVTATDNCGGAVSITFVGDSVSLSNCANRYTITRTYRATDLCGNSETCAQTITINDTNGPVITCPTNMTVSCSSDVPLPDTNLVTATDGCGGAVAISFAGDSITASNCPNNYIITRTYGATDACGNSTTCSSTITVLGDLAPSLQDVPTNLVIECGQPLPPAPVVTATSGCDALALPVYFTSVTNAPNGLLSGYHVTNCWTAMDSCGNAVQACQLITFLTCRASICVVKFDDVNTDGSQNNGEPGHHQLAGSHHGHQRLQPDQLYRREWDDLF